MEFLQKYILTVLLVACAIALGAFVFIKHYKPTLDVASLNMTVLSQARSVKPFTLQAADNKTFSNDNLKGHWSMMFFGFTRCPMLCPTTLSELNQVYQSLEKENLKAMPQVILVSLDPEYDTAKRVTDYAKGFNSHFIGLRGEKSILDQLTKELGIAYFKVTTNQHKHPMINHSGAIVVFDPKGKVFGFFSVPHNAKEIAHDMTMVENV